MKPIKLQDFEDYYAKAGESFMEEEHLFPFSIRFFMGYLCAKHPLKFKEAMKIYLHEKENHWNKEKPMSIDQLSIWHLLDNDPEPQVFPARDGDELYNVDELYTCFAEIGNSCITFNRQMWKILNRQTSRWTDYKGE